MPRCGFSAGAGGQPDSSVMTPRISSRRTSSWRGQAAPRPGRASGKGTFPAPRTSQSRSRSRCGGCTGGSGPPRPGSGAIPGRAGHSAMARRVTAAFSPSTLRKERSMGWVPSFLAAPRALRAAVPSRSGSTAAAMMASLLTFPPAGTALCQGEKGRIEF